MILPTAVFKVTSKSTRPVTVNLNHSTAERWEFHQGMVVPSREFSLKHTHFQGRWGGACRLSPLWPLPGSPLGVFFPFLFFLSYFYSILLDLEGNEENVEPSISGRWGRVTLLSYRKHGLVGKKLELSTVGSGDLRAGLAVPGSKTLHGFHKGPCLPSPFQSPRLPASQPLSPRRADEELGTICVCLGQDART